MAKMSFVLGCFIHLAAAISAASTAPGSATTPSASEWPLIPRATFFSHPERMRVRLSPDGRSYSYVAAVPNDDGTVRLAIFMVSRENKEVVRTVLDDGNPRMPEYYWTRNPGKMVFFRDIDGNENNQIHLLDVATGRYENLTNDPEVKTHFVGLPRKFPELVLFKSNARTKVYFDTLSLNVLTGETRVVFENTQEFLGVMLDDDLKPRIGFKYDEDGRMAYFIARESGWENLFTVPVTNVGNTGPVAADWDSGILYLVDSRGRDKAALKSLNLETREETVLVEDTHADIDGVITDESGSQVLAAVYEYTRAEAMPLTSAVEDEFRKIRSLAPGADFQLMSRTPDDGYWLVLFQEDTRSNRYFLWDRKRQVGELAFVMQPELDRLNLARMHPVIIKARDGLKMVSYLTLPTNVAYDPETLRPERPVPAIVLPHGGPWARDSWGYNPYHQWLANRGFAVLSPNFRGSTGFGSAHETASYGEWGGKMHDDLVDARQWLIDQGISNSDRIGIMGASYGGYATLVGLTFTPDLWAAGVDEVGVANLITFDESIPPYWRAFKANNVRRMGADGSTEEGRAFFRERSPLFRAHQIRRPLLIGHGDQDPRVKVAEAMQMTEAMKQLGLPVTLVRFPDEGHGLARPENSSTFAAITEAFLAAHLGGRAEPLIVVPGTSAQVAEGAEHIPGLCDALLRLNR